MFEKFIFDHFYEHLNNKTSKTANKLEFDPTSTHQDFSHGCAINF